MKDFEYIFFENRQKYKEIVELRSAPESREDNISGVAYKKINENNIVCKEIKDEEKRDYNKKEAIQFGNSVIESIIEREDKVTYAKCVLITENTKNKICIDDTIHKKYSHNGHFVCLVEYQINGKRIERLFSKGIVNFNDSFSDMWFNKLKVDELVKHFLIDESFRHIRKINKGVYDMYMSPNAVGIMIHEVFGHIFEKDNFKYNREIINRLSTIDFNSNITIEDDPLRESCGGYSIVDDIGRPCRKNKIIDRGRITEHILQGETINNRRRGHYYYNVQYRVTNTILSNGIIEKKDLLNEVINGLYIKKVDQCFCDPMNGRIILPVIEAYYVENGVKQSYVLPFTIITNVFDLAKNIEEISDDYEEDTIFCGKMGDQIIVGIGACGALLRNMNII